MNPNAISVNRAAATGRRPLVRSPRRLALAAAGLLCVGLGLLGIVVPGMPTTVFLILASYLFTRSCPILERRILGHPVFHPYRRYLDGTSPMPRRARVVALSAMWGAVAISVATLVASGRGGVIGPAAIACAALAGTLVIARVRRGPVDTLERTGGV